MCGEPELTDNRDTIEILPLYYDMWTMRFPEDSAEEQFIISSQPRTAPSSQSPMMAIRWKRPFISATRFSCSGSNLSKIFLPAAVCILSTTKGNGCSGSSNAKPIWTVSRCRPCPRVPRPGTCRLLRGRGALEGLRDGEKMVRIKMGIQQNKYLTI